VAKATFKMPEDFLMKLSRLGEKTDEIIPRVLKAGGEVVEAKVKSNLQSVIGNGTKEDSRSTGELVSALGVSSARQDRDGNFNVMVAGVLEYGKHGQTPKPFLKPAKTASKNTCVEAMIRAFEEEVDKI